MAESVIECVPNFSEGRDRAVVDSIAETIASSPGAKVLDLAMDPDHNRSVITFAGSPNGVAEGAFRAIAHAVSSIDLTRHKGVHPRIGAADVVPFVPVNSATLEECATLARSTGERVWRELRVPVYLYEAAARRPDRVGLENVRREVRRNPSATPDIGDPGPHPTAGATVIGARRFLIAFNVNLDTTDLEIARHIAVAVRASSGGLPYLKALGVPLASRGLVQVTMNLTDFERTPVHAAFEAVRREAGLYGVRIRSSEIVGLIPRRALERADTWLPTVEGFHDGMILENRI